LLYCGMVISTGLSWDTFTICMQGQQARVGTGLSSRKYAIYRQHAIYRRICDLSSTAAPLYRRHHLDHLQLPAPGALHQDPPPRARCADSPMAGHGGLRERMPRRYPTRRLSPAATASPPKSAGKQATRYAKLAGSAPCASWTSPRGTWRNFRWGVSEDVVRRALAGASFSRNANFVLISCPQRHLHLLSLEIPIQVRFPAVVIIIICA
jgi:hypothetical protein